MIRRRPDLLALIVALSGTLAVLIFFLGDLVLSRERELEIGERRVQHFGIMLGEHTARTFEAVDILLREIAGDLSGSDNGWDKWTPAQGWEYLAQRHSRALPQLRDLAIFDREGYQRHISTYFPTPRINVRDRPYFTALESGQAASAYGPYIGRNSGRYTYGLARRINDARGRFAGVVFAAIEPAYFQAHCWSNRLADDFESVVINARGQIVTSCRPTDLSRQSPLIGALAVDALYGGALRGWLPENGVARAQGLIASVSPVPDFPDLRVLTAIPQPRLLAAWRSHLFELGTLVVLVTVILLAGGLLVRRQVREMREMTEKLASGRDLLEARVGEATAELSRQKDQAERANRAKSRFLAAASHDLRQPLHALSLFAADLQRLAQSGGTTDLPRVADQIAASTAVLGELFDSLLDISRLDVVGIQPDIRPFPLAPGIERLVASFRGAAAERNQTLVFRPTTRWAESDPLMVERMVANLIANAIRYTQPGGRILVAARRRDRHVVIEVRDNGPGIAPEHQAEIFTEFYQIGNPAREQGKGLGLGLSIIDRLARALGIDVRLRSAPGRGTTFGLELPAARPVPVSGGKAAADANATFTVRFVGDSDDLPPVVDLVRTWGYPVAHDAAPGDALAAMSRTTVIIVAGDDAAAVRARCHQETPVIALADPGDPILPDDVYALHLPVRPARLRALLVQLQKTSLKSTP